MDERLVIEIQLDTLESVKQQIDKQIDRLKLLLDSDGDAFKEANEELRKDDHVSLQ